MTTFTRDGFPVVPAVLRPGDVARLTDALTASSARVSLARGKGVYAMRNLLDVPAVRDVAQGRAFRLLVEPVLGASARPVRGILFDKTPGANWKVAWHQDLSIAVRERHDVGGYGPWSVKDGVVHVQPPRDVLERMVTVRLHLDDCGEGNGPLKVLPGSHAHGVLPPDAVTHWTTTAAPVPCVVPSGGAVVMRPLILHASRAATQPSHRRVVHVEFAAGDLPPPLRWAVE